MSHIFSLLSVSLLGLGGYLMAKRWPRLAKRACDAKLAATAVMLCTLVVSGIMHGTGELGLLHRWMGHAIVISNWCSMRALCGIFFRWRHTTELRRMTLAIVLLLLLLVATVLGSMTGYLGPLDGVLPLESRNRFVVPHMGFFPACMAALLAGVWLLAPWNRAAD